MITDAHSEGDLIAALHLEPLDAAVQPHFRLESIQSLALSAQRLSIKNVMPRAVLFEKNGAAAFRAAANIAAWRTYLPENCVAAMINDGWHWST
jgi:hypothetical protein